MLVLVVATAAARKVPAVVEEKPHHIPHFHARRVCVWPAYVESKNETWKRELGRNLASRAVPA